MKASTKSVLPKSKIPHIILEAFRGRACLQKSVYQSLNDEFFLWEFSQVLHLQTR